MFSCETFSSGLILLIIILSFIISIKNQNSTPKLNYFDLKVKPRMGNILRSLYKECCKPSTSDESSLGHHGVSSTAVGLSALAQDIFNFDINSQVPEGLSKHVVSSKKAQANWYRKLLEAWGEAKPPPKTPEDASRLIILTLKHHQKADVEGLLAFYGLPLPHNLVEVTAGVPTAGVPTAGVPTSLPEGVMFEMHTLPVDPKAIPDGDTITVYVSTTDPRESSCVPKEVQVAAVKRSKARVQKNYPLADEHHKKIIHAGYRVIHLQQHDEEVLARKYRIRFKGIDTPESKMPYGQEAKEELVKLIQGKCLKIFVYDTDRYGRSVGDVYCNGMFIQELMLKKGCAWHYPAYDKRQELATWEKEARAKRVGLWAASNPEKPWDWRRDRRPAR